MADPSEHDVLAPRFLLRSAADAAACELVTRNADARDTHVGYQVLGYSDMAND